MHLTYKKWKERLFPDEFNILGNFGTEKLFNHELNNKKEKGVYACRVCELELFASGMRYGTE